MNDLSREWLPASMGSEWTEITLQQIIAEQDVLTKLAFPLAVVFVFLVLSAVRELVAADVDYLDRADVSVGVDHRDLVGRNG